MYDTMENVQHKGYEDGAELLAEAENDASSIAYRKCCIIKLATATLADCPQ
jgi:histone acetyltransferase (RNA polymerase elongator complex component)